MTVCRDAGFRIEASTAFHVGCHCRNMIGSNKLDQSDGFYTSLSRRTVVKFVRAQAATRTKPTVRQNIARMNCYKSLEKCLTQPMFTINNIQPLRPRPKHHTSTINLLIKASPCLQYSPKLSQTQHSLPNSLPHPIPR